jgi:biotin carboxyl carrier protein
MARERSLGTARSNGRLPDPALTIAELRQLIALIQRSDIEEIVVEREAVDLKLTLRRPAPSLSPVADSTMIEYDIASGEVKHDEDRLGYVTAQLVGRFYVGTKPGAKPLVAVGDMVRVGQVVGSIETLNVLNEVESTVAGRVVEVKAEEGQAVEYGQPLIVVEPHGT